MKKRTREQAEHEQLTAEWCQLRGPGYVPIHRGAQGRMALQNAKDARAQAERERNGR